VGWLERDRPPECERLTEGPLENDREAEECDRLDGLRECDRPPESRRDDLAAAGATVIATISPSTMATRGPRRPTRGKSAPNRDLSIASPLMD
jgi:hypothetical protein